jgi:ABC-type transport system substrate-binding protein
MRIQDPGSVLVARQLYEGLTRWDPTLEEVTPAAAQAWRVEDGGRTFVFRLRRGMTFHDGTPVTSAHFAFAFDRIALKENASDLAYTLELVQGFTEVNQLGGARHLSGIETPNELTLVIRLSEPFYELPALLTHPGLVPVTRRAVADLDSFLSAPVGNGPFQIAQRWAVGQDVVLESFPGFIDTPELDGIRFVTYPDAAASWLEFLDGGLDVAEVPAGQLEAAAEEFGEEGFTPLLAGYYYGLNVRSRNLGSLRLRRAIGRAVDRATIASTIYRGTMVEPRGIVPEGMPSFQENLCLVACSHSPGSRLAATVTRSTVFSGVCERGTTPCTGWDGSPSTRPRTPSCMRFSIPILPTTTRGSPRGESTACSTGRGPRPPTAGAACCTGRRRKRSCATSRSFRSAPLRLTGPRSRRSRTSDSTLWAASTPSA